MGVDAGNEPLPSRFLIARGAVDLTGEEEVLDQFGLEGVGQLSGVKEVILDGITRSEGMNVAQGGDVSQRLDLHLPR